VGRLLDGHEQIQHRPGLAVISMTTKRQLQHPLERLDFSNRVRKRAEYEAFEFSLVPDGILVRNESYVDPENHEYVVTVRDGLPVACTCPADARFEGACKHRVAVAMRRPILTLAMQAQAVADGGRTTLRSMDTPTPRDERLADADAIDSDSCEACAELDALPCWECFRTSGDETTSNTVRGEYSSCPR
jgi:hypothetical protein